MKKFLMLLFLVITPNIAFASITGETSYSILKLQFFKGLPFTDLIIQNKKQPVLVDTGAGDIEVFLKTNILRNLQLDQEPITKKYFNACGHQINETAFRLHKIQLSNLQLFNVPGIGSSKDFWCSNRQDFSIDTGLIGLKLLSRYNILVDYSRKQIILTDSTLPSPYHHIPWHWFKFTTPNNSGIVTEETVNGKKLRLLWDTGSNFSHLNGLKLANSQLGTCPSSWEEPINCQVLTTNNLLLNEYSLGPATFLLLPNLKAPFDGTIGGNFFETHLVYFDFKNKLIGIQNLNTVSKQKNHSKNTSVL